MLRLLTSKNLHFTKLLIFYTLFLSEYCAYSHVQPPEEGSSHKRDACVGNTYYSKENKHPSRTFNAGPYSATLPSGGKPARRLALAYNSIELTLLLHIAVIELRLLSIVVVKLLLLMSTVVVKLRLLLIVVALLLPFSVLTNF